MLESIQGDTVAGHCGVEPHSIIRFRVWGLGFRV